MIARAAAIVAAALALSACVAVPPPGPTAEQVADYNDDILRATWITTGLSEVFPRPEVTQGDTLDIDDWLITMSECMTANGYAEYAMGYNPRTGFVLYGPSGGGLATAAMQLSFYRCAAAHPVEVVSNHQLLSPAQIDYVYDYYQQWVVPCLIAEGVMVRDPPTRQGFHEVYGQWSPYGGVHNSIGGSEVDDLQRICGADRPAL